MIPKCSSLTALSPKGTRWLQGTVLCLCFCLLAIGSVSSIHAEVFTVGPGGDCTHTSLSDAIAAAAANGPDQDEVRPSMSYYNNVALTIGTSIRLIGGLSNCSDTTPSGFTDLIGSPGSAVVTVSGDVTVSFEDIFITNGDTNLVGVGGALTVDGSEVLLQDSEIFFNQGFDGGGILVKDGFLTLVRTDIHENAARGNGGGISCLNSSLVLVNSSLDDNDAVGFGGGVHASGCFVAGTEASVTSNKALDDGGGLYLTDGSNLSFTSGSEVESNTSLNHGGGLSLDSLSIATFENSSIDYNVSGSFGGGIDLRGSSFFDMKRAPGCLESKFCSTIRSNKAGGFVGGAAITVLDGSAAYISQTWITKNWVQDPDPWVPSLALVGSENSGLLIENSLISKNRGSDYLFGIHDSSQLHLGFTTVTHNEYQLALISSSPTSQTELFSSIIWETDGDVFLAGAGVGQLDCLLVHELGSMPTATGSLVADPLLTDPLGNNYAPRPGSPAIDYCDDSVYSSPLDLYDDDRPWYTPQPNHFGPYDLGAIEVHLLFFDGFESGDTNAWNGI